MVYSSCLNTHIKVKSHKIPLTISESIKQMVDGCYILNNPRLLDVAHKLFLMQMFSGEFKRLDMVIRLHQWFLILCLYLVDRI